MKLLLDTCVISEIAHPKGSPRVKDRVAALKAADVFISVITLGEIVSGIEGLEPGRRRSQLELFLLRLEQDFEGRLLPVDAETARIWGEVIALGRRRGETVPPVDGLLAATALRHGLHVMTRDAKHFALTGALIVNPWSDA